MSILDNSYPQIKVQWELGTVPSEEDCVKLWDKYGMLSNVREHSRLVGEYARALARLIHEKLTSRAEEVCKSDCLADILALDENYIDLAHRAGLLHDIAKTWTIQNGGSHQQAGSSIIRAETENTLLSSCVLHHVVWPWEEGILGLEENIAHLPFLIAYADKRIKHTSFVTIEERFADLFDRYGTTEDRRANIQLNFEQAQRIERAFGKKLGRDLNSYTFKDGFLIP